MGLFIALGNSIFGDYELIASITGFSIMLFSFYLMYLNSKQKNLYKENLLNTLFYG